MGTRIPTVPYSSPNLESLLERDGAAGGEPSTASVASSSSRRERVKRPMAQAASAAALATHSPLAYAAAAGGLVVIVGATIGGSKALRVGALAVVGVAAFAFLVARRPQGFARLLDRAKAEVSRAARAA